jgi:hypothetical protein
MVEEESLHQLIERLQQLHLEQERILAALENIVAADSESEPAPAAAVTEPVSPVSVAESEPVHPTTPVAVPVPVPRGQVFPVAQTVAAFHIGQRVYITNRITHVLVRRATEADRTAIVTHFTPTRVAIRTINGFNTHRHPKNLRPL